MSNSRARLILLAAVALVALALRLAWLDAISLWWDEFVTLSRARLPFAEIWRSLSYQGPADGSLDSSPPLLHLILHGVLALGGASETWVKLPGVVFGVLTVMVLYPLGTRAFGGRAGLYASALLALSLFHLHYSREVRPYSLYLLLSTASLWLLLRALESNRRLAFAAWAASLALTLYASYLGAASLAAQGAYLALLAATRKLPPGRLLPAGAALAAAVLAYLPWLPGHLFHMELIYSPDAGMGLSWEFLSRALLEFTSGAAALPAMAAFGAGASLWRGGPPPLLILVWALTPLAAALALRTGIAVNPRYLINFAPALALFAGAGVDALVRGLSLALPGRVAALAGLLAAIGLSWPSLTGLEDYYRRERHSVRDDLLAVAENAANADTIAFARNRHLKAFSHWYLRDTFGDLASSGDLGYRRALLLAQAGALPPGFAQTERHGDIAVSRQGVLNVSPLPAARPYRARFHDLSFHREAALWRNAAPDMLEGCLSLYDPERPGLAVWRFTAPEGGFDQSIPVRLRLRLTASRAAPRPDARVTLLAGDAPDRLVAVKTATQADFDGTLLDVAANVPRPSGSELAVGVALEPGTIHGAIDVVSFEADFPERPESPAGRAAREDEVRRRAKLVLWTPGVIEAGEPMLAAFPAGTHGAQAPSGGSGPEAFLAAHPGLAPVALLPGLAVYDPALASPFVRVPGQMVRFGGGELRGVTVRGPMSGQMLDLGGTSLRLPLLAPSGSALALSPGGSGRLRARLGFPGGEGGPFASFNTVAVPEGPYLTCSGENPCFAVWAIDSEAPVAAFRLVHTPEAYGEPGQANGVTLSFSTGGNSYKTLDSMRVKDSELWEGKKRRVAWVTLEKPSTRLYLRLELTGEKARLFMGGEHPMRLDAWLKSAASLPRVMPQGPFTPGDAGEPVRVFLSPKPLPDLDRLLAPH
jgi:4-amino-4-deoxy-L-arabinose transferase-like glycosyltransferase